MLYDNSFTNFFKSLINSRKKIKKNLDYYWENNMMKEYWDLYYKMNNRFKIIQNPDGKHTVRKE